MGFHKSLILLCCVGIITTAIAEVMSHTNDEICAEKNMIVVDTGYKNNVGCVLCAEIDPVCEQICDLLAPCSCGGDTESEEFIECCEDGDERCDDRCPGHNKQKYQTIQCRVEPETCGETTCPHVDIRREFKKLHQAEKKYKLASRYKQVRSISTFTSRDGGATFEKQDMGRPQVMAMFSDIRGTLRKAKGNGYVIDFIHFQVKYHPWLGIPKVMDWELAQTGRATNATELDTNKVKIRHFRKKKGGRKLSPAALL